MRPLRLEVSSMMVSIFCLIGPQHPVRTFDPTDHDDASLIQDIRERGVVKPLRVRRLPNEPRDDASYELTEKGFERVAVGPFYRVLDGMRRLEAAVEAGLVEVPVTVEGED